MKTFERFEDMPLDARLKRAVDGMGFDRPTPVQSAAIPAGLDGRDVLACAATGSGKTAAFLLPILQRLLGRERGATRALILTPTRELAAQIEEHMLDLARHTDLRVASVFGGVPMGPQVTAFKRGVDVVVATPGRLLDHMERDYAGMEALEVLVLDEADRMLDMGFLPAIRRVLRHLPQRQRQTLFFSATMPKAIVQLAGELLDRPVSLEIERRQAPAAGVLQALYPVPQNLKVPLLLELLERGEVGNAIVFCRTKHRANRVAQKLERAGIDVARIHGNRSQKQRTEALAGFKDGRYRVLVATDILARGIDVEALEHVVNFDVPVTPEDYIHRVGRTGRAEATGDAYTFVAPDEEELIRQVERKVGSRIERRRLDGFDYSARPAEKLEVPREERIAAIRAQRQRARDNADRRERARAEGERGGNDRGGNDRGGNGRGSGGGRGQGRDGAGRNGSGGRASDPEGRTGGSGRRRRRGGRRRSGGQAGR